MPSLGVSCYGEVAEIALSLTAVILLIPTKFSSLFVLPCLERTVWKNGGSKERHVTKAVSQLAG